MGGVRLSSRNSRTVLNFAGRVHLRRETKTPVTGIGSLKINEKFSPQTFL